jgi:RNA polymerase sigma factor (sigma-70 family)
MDDSQLLQEYVATRSQRAFALLVERYIQLVYAAARRQVRDAHLAEDVTQAVFIVLARRAKTIRSGAVLPAWLLSATRYTASNHLSGLNRRRHHESRAAQMLHGRDEPAVAVSDDAESMAGQLDEAMARLNAKDRSAVAMRFLQGKSLREVGDLMGISEEAAQKRVIRAIEKLRSFFVRQGIAMDSAADLVKGLSRQLAHAAPASLAPAVTAAALSSAKTAGAGATLGGLGKLFGLVPGKIAAAVCITAVVAAGTSAVVVQSRSGGEKNMAPAPAPAAAKAPAAATPLWQPFVPDNSPPITTATFANLALLPAGATSDYDSGIDPNVKRMPESQPAGMIRCTAETPTVRNPGFRAMTTISGPYRGKRIRLSGYLKSENVESFAGLILVVWGPDQRVLANDDMGGRPVLGTTDWKKYDIVADVPMDAERIDLGVVLRGKGTLWSDGLELSVVNNTVPFTDDRRWHMWSFTPNLYKVELDKNEMRNGHPTVCLSSTGMIPGGGWGNYDHNIRNCEQWLGKRVKMSAWMKCENVLGSGISMRSLGPAFTTLTRDNTFGHRPLKGTSGWLKYSVTLDVPLNAQGVDAGVTMNGGGKIWVDDVQFEVVEAGK